jgi:transposase-like protein
VKRKKSRRRFTPSFKAEVALAALRGDRTLQDLSQQYKIHANVIGEWRKQLLEGAGSVFESGGTKEEASVDTNALYRKIGQLEMERDFLVSRPGLMSLVQRGGR